MSLPADLQSHFDALPMDRQIEVVHELWDRIAARPTTAPIPQWHIDELRRRTARPETATAENSWENVRENLLRRLDRRK